MSRVLIVGSGITGAVTASLLKTRKHDYAVTVWDKARGSGGRMSTSRSPFDNKCTCDLGAQYISTSLKYAELHKQFYADLLSSGILEPLKVNIGNVRENEEGTSHFVAPNGMNSLVKYFLSRADCQPVFSKQVTEINLHDGKWLIHTNCGHQEEFDAVVLTIPVPQILQLKGTISKILGEAVSITSDLKQVEYSSRYALGLYYEKGTKLDDLAHKMCYLDSDPVFRFMAVDNFKRNQDELAPSVTLHTSVPYAVQHLEKTVEQMEPLLMEAARKSFPDLPPPKAVKCHKWRYSQVSQSYPGQPGVVQLCDNPKLLIGGDGMYHSNLDGCLSSAERIIARL